MSGKRRLTPEDRRAVILSAARTVFADAGTTVRRCGPSPRRPGSPHRCSTTTSRRRPTCTPRSWRPRPTHSSRPGSRRGSTCRTARSSSCSGAPSARSSTGSPRTRPAGGSSFSTRPAIPPSRRRIGGGRSARRPCSPRSLPGCRRFSFPCPGTGTCGRLPRGGSEVDGQRDRRVVVGQPGPHQGPDRRAHRRPVVARARPGDRRNQMSIEDLQKPRRTRTSNWP